MPEQPADLTARHAVTGDAVLDGRVRLSQPPGGYRAAIDPILLAAAVPAGDEDRVADLGCGVGTAALCLAARVAGCRIVGLDLQDDLVDLALANVQANGWADRITAVSGNVAGPPRDTLPAGGFTRVMANPPYLDPGRHREPPLRSKALAMIGDGTPLDQWVATGHRLLAPRGWFILIHRADCMTEVLASVATRFGGIELIPIFPALGKPACRIIVRARRDVRTPPAILPGLTLHADNGAFTAEAEGVLRDACALAGA